MGAFFGISVFRFLFGGRPNSKQSQQFQNRKKHQSSSKKTKKIISRNEGEYVDFEEIKDQNNKS
jgi:hypothetical protein